MFDFHGLILVAIMAIVTYLIRATPFLVFSRMRSVPKIVTYLGDVLPYAIMGMLVVYCLKSLDFTAMPFGLPEIIGVIVTAVLHISFRKTLISIGGGTLVYIVIVNFIV